MASDMEFRALTEEEQDARLEALLLAERLVGDTSPFSVEQVQELYEALLAEASRPAAMQIALGIAFGELIAHSADFEWVKVTDDYGSETALARQGFLGACFPISMIKKRLQRGEKIDVAELRDETIRVVEERKDQWSERRGS